MGAGAITGIIIDDSGRIGAAKGLIVADSGPDPSRDRLAGRHDGHMGAVVMNPVARQDMGLDEPDQAPQEDPPSNSRIPRVKF